jgi:hypothetical protein
VLQVASFASTGRGTRFATANGGYGPAGMRERLLLLLLDGTAGPDAAASEDTSSDEAMSPVRGRGRAAQRRPTVAGRVLIAVRGQSIGVSGRHGAVGYRDDVGLHLRQIDEADELLTNDSLALLIGMVLDQPESERWSGTGNPHSPDRAGDGDAAEKVQRPLHQPVTALV